MQQASVPSESEVCLRRALIVLNPILFILNIVYSIMRKEPLMILGFIPTILSVISSLVTLRYNHLLKSQDDHRPELLEFNALNGLKRGLRRFRAYMKVVAFLDWIVAVTALACWIVWSIYVSQRRIGDQEPLVAAYMLCILSVLWVCHTFFVVKKIKDCIVGWVRSFSHDHEPMPMQCAHCGKVVLPTPSPIPTRNHQYRVIPQDYRDSEESERLQHGAQLSHDAIRTHNALTETFEAPQQKTNVSA